MFDPDTRILIVDDMMTMRKIIINGLKRINLKNVVEAEDGDIAWRILERSEVEGRVGLIICDWNMPRMKGIDLLKKVRANEEYKEIPFLMVTAEAEQKAVLEAVQQKVSNYVVKPFSPGTLEEKLQIVYKKHHA